MTNGDCDPPINKSVSVTREKNERSNCRFIVARRRIGRSSFASRKCATGTTTRKRSGDVHSPRVQVGKSVQNSSWKSFAVSVTWKLLSRDSRSHREVNALLGRFCTSRKTFASFVERFAEQLDNDVIPRTIFPLERETFPIVASEKLCVIITQRGIWSTVRREKNAPRLLEKQ